MKTYTEQFKAWWEPEKRNGLVDIKFAVGDISNATVESFAREALEIIHSKPVELPETL